MRRREFLKILSSRIDCEDGRERTNILNYYDELISDKMEMGYTEEEAIEQLGTINEIVKKLNAAERFENVTTHQSNYNKIKYDSIIDEEEFRENITKTNAKNHSSEEAKYNHYDNNNNYNNNDQRNKRELSLLAIVLIIILGCIFVGPIIGVTVGILGGIFGVFIGIVAIGFSLGFSGIAAIVKGIILLPTNELSGIFTIGCGIVLIGLAIMLTPALLKFAKWCISVMTKIVKVMISGLRKGLASI